MSGFWTYLCISSLTEPPWDGFEKSFKNCWWSLKLHDKVMAAREKMGGGNEKRLHLDSCMHGVCTFVYNEWTYSMCVGLHSTVSKLCMHIRKAGLFWFSWAGVCKGLSLQGWDMQTNRYRGMKEMKRTWIWILCIWNLEWMRKLNYFSVHC